MREAMDWPDCLFEEKWRTGKRLRPLRWFGLVECRGEVATRRGHGMWRKTPLFDRFVQFDPQPGRDRQGHAALTRAAAVTGRSGGRTRFERVRGRHR